MKKSRKEGRETRASLLENRKRLLTNDTPFAVKEAYVKLRTSLMFCMTADKSHACRVFAVTSSHPGEGKSLTAANIAISYAMLGKKTLLIDADLRKSTQRLLWNVEAGAGLCDFLAGLSDLKYEQVEGLPLTLICTGTIPPNPSELLASDKMKRFVQACGTAYDYVIVDTPPINTVADAQIVSAFVDGVVLVSRSGGTRAEDLNEAIDGIRRADGNLCGVVLNDINMKTLKHSYGYKYGDKYGSKYGYKYSYEESYGTGKH